MPIDQNDAEQLKAARDIAEEALAESKAAADVLRVAYSMAVLSDAFPQHSLVVFARSWDQDEPRIIQILSATEGVEDIDVQEPEAVSLSDEQWRAINEADNSIVAIGSDEEIWQHLDAGEEEHEDWYEFDLAINIHADESMRCPTDPPGLVDGDGFCTKHGNDCTDFAMSLRDEVKQEATAAQAHGDRRRADPHPVSSSHAE